MERIDPASAFLRLLVQPTVTGGSVKKALTGSTDFTNEPPVDYN